MEDKQSETSLTGTGIKWARDCIDEFGFVYTLGLLRFITVVVEEEMSADMMKSRFEGTKQ